MSPEKEHIDNEWFVVRHSGELPEVALHSSLYYLTEAEEGPKLTLAQHHVRELQAAAMERYRDIILRDLLPENRNTPMYRGVKRAIINYQRYQRFCHRQDLEVTAGFTGEVAEAFSALLAAEVTDAAGGGGETSLNCSFHELQCFAAEIGLSAEVLPKELAGLCPVPVPSGEVAIV
jgi:hypothetical protein